MNLIEFMSVVVVVVFLRVMLIFSYEVSRSLKACQGVLLLVEVDAQQVGTRTAVLYTLYRTSDRGTFFSPL